MSPADDKRHLSGLARSIDALFAQPSPSAPSDEAPTVPLEALPSSSEAPEPEVAPSETAFAGGWSDEGSEPHWDVDARTGEYYTADHVEETPVAEVPPESPVGWEKAEELALDALEVEAQEAPIVPLAPVATFVDVTDAEAVTAEHAPGPDPDALAHAVDAFLAGSPGAAAEVRDLAEGLRERLALDPLADAVERLAREAGDPPDPTLLDMAEEIINPAVASRIVQRIGHERDERRLAEYEVLCRRLGEIMARAFRGALTGATDDDARRSYYDMLIAMGDASRPIIEEMVEDENTLLLRSGIQILGETGGERAVELVTSGLAHPDKRVRREALLSLAKLGDEESGALVVGFLEDPDEDVRVAAARAAGELQVARALKPLLAQLEAAGDGEGAIPFIDALGKLGDPGAVPAIEKHAVKTLFSKPRPEVRIAAYRALHRIGTPHARELVQKALDAKEPGVWVGVRQAVDAEGEA